MFVGHVFGFCFLGLFGNFLPYGTIPLKNVAPLKKYLKRSKLNVYGDKKEGATRMSKRLKGSWVNHCVCRQPPIVGLKFSKVPIIDKCKFEKDCDPVQN